MPRPVPALDNPCMVKRVAASVLWLLAVGWGMNYISVIVGAPPIIGLTLSAAIAAFIGMDPLHLVWPAPAPTAVARMREPRIVHGAVRPNA
jgi:hypothetical protein